MVFETPLGRGTHRLQPRLQMLERRDVVEAAVAKGRAVEALGRSEPADLAVEPVVVVVANVLGQGRLGLCQRAEDLAVEDLRLEDAPEALDLAVRPGRVHLGADVADVQLLQSPAEARKHAGDPVHERRAVVAHELERYAAQINSLAQPGQDRSEDRIAVDAQTEHEARVVIDQADDPGLQASPRGELDEEGPLDVDVPELVGPAALVARSPLRRQRRARCPVLVEEPLDPAVAHRRDAAAAQLGRDALGIPVRGQAHGDDDELDPDGVTEPGDARAAPLRAQLWQTPGRVGRPPAEQRGAAGLSDRERRTEALLPPDAQRASAPAHHRDRIRTWNRIGRSAAARGQKAKARPFLKSVPQPAPLGVALMRRRRTRSAIDGPPRSPSGKIPTPSRTLVGPSQNSCGTTPRPLGARPRTWDLG